MPEYLVYGLDIETGFDPRVLADHSDTCRTDEIPAIDPRHALVKRAVVSTAAGDLTFDGDEPELLASLDRCLADLEPGILATWNGSGFALPYLADRAQARQIRLGLHLAVDPRLARRGDVLPGHRHAYRAAWHRHRHIDSARLYRSGRRPLVAVDELLRSIRLAGRERLLHPARATPPAANALAHDAVHAFATNDARLVRSLVEARLPNVVKYADRVKVTQPTPPARQWQGSRTPGAFDRIPLSPAHPAVRAALSGNHG